MTDTEQLGAARLVPTGDSTPAEEAAVKNLAGFFQPDHFLWITIHRPDGRTRVWYGWTPGADVLGDELDSAAAAAGFDSADWLYILGRHVSTLHRQGIVLQAHPLRLILECVQGGERAPESERTKLQKMITMAGEATGQAPMPRWVGVGPALLTANA